MIIHQCQQGTTAWLALRAGIPTASMFDNIMTSGGEKGKPKASASLEPYLNHLLAERICGKPIDGFKSQWMDRGNEYETRAVASYELEHDCETEKVGFVTTDDGLIGCSPDRFVVPTDGIGGLIGLTGARRLLECKAPTLPNHVGYLRAATGAMSAYKVQLMGQMWVCEAESVDIISYNPEAPKAAQNAVFRVERDEEFIRELAAHVRAFSYRLEEIALEFKQRGWIPEPQPAMADDETGFLTQEDLDWAMTRSL